MIEQEIYLYGSNGRKYKILSTVRKQPIGRRGKTIAIPKDNFLMSQFIYLGIEHKTNDL